MSCLATQEEEPSPQLLGAPFSEARLAGFVSYEHWLNQSYVEYRKSKDGCTSHDDCDGGGNLCIKNICAGPNEQRADHSASKRYRKLGLNSLTTVRQVRSLAPGLVMPACYGGDRAGRDRGSDKKRSVKKLCFQGVSAACSRVDAR